MTTTEIVVDDVKLQIDLKNAALAGLLSWLIPGAGQLYQRRTAKGLLFMVCVLSTFFYGLFIGGGKVVYASNRAEDRRLPYLCQVCVGLPALPALVQMVRMHQSEPKAPLWGGFMAPPILPGQVVPRGLLAEGDGEPMSERFERSNIDELADWHYRLNRFFDLGTVYTMIAGLLNVLVVYDAACGPLVPEAKKAKAEKKNGAEG